MFFVNLSSMIVNNHVQVFRVIHKEIPGYDGAYCVGSDGGVWSRWVRVGWSAYIIGTEKDWVLLKQGIDSDGYPNVGFSRNGKAKTFKVHKLVMEAFIGPCPLGMEGCHEDGVRLNSNLCNLRYDTRQGNSDDRIKHGTECRGERHGNAFLTWGLVDKIRAEYAAGGVTKTTLAAKYHTTRSHVGRIIRYEAWVRS